MAYRDMIPEMSETLRVDMPMDMESGAETALTASAIMRGYKTRALTSNMDIYAYKFAASMRNVAKGAAILYGTATALRITQNLLTRDWQNMTKVLEELPLGVGDVVSAFTQLRHSLGWMLESERNQLVLVPQIEAEAKRLAEIYKLASKKREFVSQSIQQSAERAQAMELENWLKKQELDIETLKTRLEPIASDQSKPIAERMSALREVAARRERLVWESMEAPLTAFDEETAKLADEMKKKDATSKQLEQFEQARNRARRAMVDSARAEIEGIRLEQSRAEMQMKEQERQRQLVYAEPISPYMTGQGFVDTASAEAKHKAELAAEAARKKAIKEWYASFNIMPTAPGGSDILYAQNRLQQPVIPAQGIGQGPGRSTEVTLAGQAITLLSAIAANTARKDAVVY